MRTYIVLSVLLLLPARLAAQPWKFEEDFALAFKMDYFSYHLRIARVAEGTFYVGFDSNNTSLKLFEFKTSLSGQKHGWFRYTDTGGNGSYSILFEKGEARKLSYSLHDSSIAIYSIGEGVLNGVHTVYYANGNMKEYGFYKQNARTGLWTFFYSSGKLESEGYYEGNYERLLYDTCSKKIFTLNRFLDTIKTEAFTAETYDSLKLALKQPWGMVFHCERHFKTGEWKYYNVTGRLVREEYYEKDRFIKREEIAAQ